jgi:hypothetical protein
MSIDAPCTPARNISDFFTAGDAAKSRHLQVRTATSRTATSNAVPLLTALIPGLKAFDFLALLFLCVPCGKTKMLKFVLIWN